ncbi:hypothetical protein C1T21_11780 [Paenibacillus sp. F4]|nr:hypothetical protein C1T21_11780 [Paenibacillus sp. F4]
MITNDILFISLHSINIISKDKLSIFIKYKRTNMGIKDGRAEEIIEIEKRERRGTPEGQKIHPSRKGQHTDKKGVKKGLIGARDESDRGRIEEK